MDWNLPDRFVQEAVEDSSPQSPRRFCRGHGANASLGELRANSPRSVTRTQCPAEPAQPAPLRPAAFVGACLQAMRGKRRPPGTALDPRQRTPGHKRLRTHGSQSAQTILQEATKATEGRIEPLSHRVVASAASAPHPVPLVPSVAINGPVPPIGSPPAGAGAGIRSV